MSRRYFMSKLFSRSKEERLRIQNARLINHDFPWLWAIRNIWNPGFADIKVIDITSFISNADFHYFLDSAKSDIEVWLRYGAYGTLDKSCSRIIRVRLAKNFSGKWAERILGAVAVGLPINNIVTIRKKSSAMITSKKTIMFPDMVRIYRAKIGSDRTFNKMLVSIIRSDFPKK